MPGDLLPNHQHPADSMRTQQLEAQNHELLLINAQLRHQLFESEVNRLNVARTLQLREQNLGAFTVHCQSISEIHQQELGKVKAELQQAEGLIEMQKSMITDMEELCRLYPPRQEASALQMDMAEGYDLGSPESACETVFRLEGDSDQQGHSQPHYHNFSVASILQTDEATTDGKAAKTGPEHDLGGQGVKRGGAREDREKQKKPRKTKKAV